MGKQGDVPSSTGQPLGSSSLSEHSSPRSSSSSSSSSDSNIASLYHALDQLLGSMTQTNNDYRLSHVGRGNHQFTVDTLTRALEIAESISTDLAYLLDEDSERRCCDKDGDEGKERQ